MTLSIEGSSVLTPGGDAERAARIGKGRVLTVMSISAIRPAPAKAAAAATWVLVAALAMAACHDAVAPPPIGPSIRIVPVADSVFEGDTVRLTALVLDAAGAPDTTAPVVWAVGDTTLAEVVGDGIFALRRPGTVRLTARSGTVTTTYDLVIGRLVVVRVELTPDTINMGRTDQLPVAAHALGQGDRSITGRTAVFTSDDTLVAIVPGPGSSGSTDTGLLIAVGPGWTTIRASVDGVVGTAHVSVVVVDTTFALTAFNGSPIPLLVAVDSLVVDSVTEFFEEYVDAGALVLSGLLQRRYALEVRSSIYQVFQAGDSVRRELRFQGLTEHDAGLVTVGEDGNLTMVSEVIGPRLEHTATLAPDGYLVHYRIPGTISHLDLQYRRDGH
jgi:hypothetical protein